MKVLFILTENLFTIVEAQLGKAVNSYEFLFIVVIDISLSLGRRFIIGTDTSQLFTLYKKEGEYYEYIELQLMTYY